MLTELHVRDLGVIEEVRITFGPGMTALTGETGAGKTLLVEALELLLGGRPDPVLVRPGAHEALVEGRFVVDDEELILARALPVSGRSRAWIDGRMAPVSGLAEAGSRLVDLHGQHAQQSLLNPSAQRAALDSFAGVDLTPLTVARASRSQILHELETLGGDRRGRTREADLLRYQIEEIEVASISGGDEDEILGAEEERLAEAGSHREAAARALSALDGSGAGVDVGADTASGRRSGRGNEGSSGAIDLLGEACSALESRLPLRALAERLGAAQAELSDIASELRSVTETWEDDPERLADVQARRQLLRELSRKYGEGPGGVLAYAADARKQLAALESSEERAAELNAQLIDADDAIAKAERAVGGARRKAAPRLGADVQERLRALAMPHARLEVAVGEADPADDVAFGLGANPGEPVLPLSKVASGGELARTMLALRLVLTDAPPTMIFDEVDAGVGGEAATAVGSALAEVARRHQVLVVTHLAEVAAFARLQVGVTKSVVEGRTISEVRELEGEDRVTELAHVVGAPGLGDSARRHAEELLRAHT